MEQEPPEHKKVNEFLRPKAKRSLLRRLLDSLGERYLELRERASQPEFRRTLFFTGFLVFSCYLTWKMEEKADQLKAQSVRSLSLRQDLAERESQYLDRMLLRKTRVEDRQIEDVPDVQKKYRF
jgi:hypothetical protein